MVDNAMNGPPQAEAWSAARVLIVDDNAANLTAFHAILSDTNLEIVTAQSGAEAMRHLLNGEFAAILLDINMPSLDGIETARLIRRRERSRDIPIILITAYQPDQTQLLRGYASGAVDYLVKPVMPEILRAKVRIFVELYRRKKQVEWQAMQLRAVNVRLQQEMASRKEAERDAAFEREERSRVALASIADAVITTDAEGRVVTLNAMAEKLTGRNLELARGVPLREVFNPISTPGQPTLGQALVRSLMEGTGIRLAEPVEIYGPAGRRYLDVSVAPVNDRVGTIVGAVLIAHDITDRHEAELERALVLRLEQAARKSAEDAARARDEFLAVISHELRTPLNAIVGWTHILRAGEPDRGQTQRAVEAIHRSSMAQNKLIEDLLDMSRIINGKIQLARQLVDPVSVVRAAIEAVRPTAAEKSVHIECLFDNGVPKVNGDPMRLEQVFWNVLANAVKFTSRDGRVEVRVDRLDDGARIVVADDGQGIDPEFLPHVFEAFRQGDSTTTRRQGGLGLGLAIARQLIGMHGGSIAAHSEGLNRGATFTMMLPASGVAVVSTGVPSLDASLPADRAIKASLASLSDVRVLAVDDDPDTLDMVDIVLREHGALVKAAATAKEAMRVLKDWRPDVLVCDISMPEEDGYSLIRRIRALPEDERSNIPALALTAMASGEDRSRTLAAGFQAHVVKPIQFGVLLNAIASLTGRSAARPR
jgi:PAS domain S-box-containing protein